MNSFIVTLVPICLFLILKVKKALHMAQQNWYDKDRRYQKWILRNKKRVFLSYDLAIIPLFVLGLFVKMNIMVYIYVISYFIIYVLTRMMFRKEQVKKPLVFTARVKRLSVTMLILYLIPIYFIISNFDVRYMNIYYLLIAVLIYLSYYALLLAIIIIVRCLQNALEHLNLMKMLIHTLE